MNLATRIPPRAGSIASTKPAPPLLAISRVWSRAPQDTLALAPASALTRKPLWQALAKQLPAGSVLIVTTTGKEASPALTTIIDAFVARGRLVTTIGIDQLIEQQARLF